jgi:cytochrome b561
MPKRRTERRDGNFCADWAILPDKMEGSMAALHYDAVARTFHWSIVVLVLVTMPIGIAMNDLVAEGPLQDTLYVVHESIGVTIFCLMLLRLAWRLGRGAPPPSADLSRFEMLLSRSVHALLYLVLLAMPITGYLLVVAGGYPLSYFALFPVPRLVGKDEPLSQLAETGHLAMQWVIYALVAMHAAAALHHHFIRRNDVLRRMLPRWADRRRPDARANAPIKR